MSRLLLISALPIMLAACGGGGSGGNSGGGSDAGSGTFSPVSYLMLDNSLACTEYTATSQNGENNILAQGGNLGSCSRSEVLGICEHLLDAGLEYTGTSIYYPGESGVSDVEAVKSQCDLIQGNFTYGNAGGSVGTPEEPGGINNGGENVDVTAPVLSELTGVGYSQAATYTPNYSFYSSEAGLIEYSGSCRSNSINAEYGNNQITLSQIPPGIYADCKIQVRDGAGNLSQPLSISSFTIADITAPSLIESVAIGSTGDNTPDYAFSANEAGAILYEGGCASPDSEASTGENVVTFSHLADGVYDSCFIKVMDTSGNVSTPLTVSRFIIVDDEAPVVSELVAIDRVQSGNPDYIFNSSESGTLSLGGSCQSSVIAVNAGSNTILFLTLEAGYYDDCTLSVEDEAGNISQTLAISAFTILDYTAPVLAEVTAVDEMTMTYTPSYTFSTTEYGDITYGGSCSSASTRAKTGNNTIVFNELVEGLYDDCTVQVSDFRNNTSDALKISAFTVADTRRPKVSQLAYLGHFVRDYTPTLRLSISEPGTFSYSGGCSSASVNAVVGENAVVLDELAPGRYNDCTVYVTDAAGNKGRAYILDFTILDHTSPVLAEVETIGVAESSIVEYTFHSDEAGVITYQGRCASLQKEAIEGNNTITFYTLENGSYTDCALRVKDAANNTSYTLNITDFIVNNVTKPVVTEVAEIGTTASSRPLYVFNTTEEGVISYGGSCTSQADYAVIGENTVKFDSLAQGTYGDCTVTVTDNAGNVSLPLSVTTFLVDTPLENGEYTADIGFESTIRFSSNLSGYEFVHAYTSSCAPRSLENCLTPALTTLDGTDIVTPHLDHLQPSLILLRKDGVSSFKADPRTFEHFSRRDRHGVVRFKDKLWVIGGGGIKRDNYFNDVWSSIDGKNWLKVNDNAAFSPRESHEVVIFNDQIWLIGGFGEDGGDFSYLNDLWASEDGITWVEKNGNVPYPLNPLSGLGIKNQFVTFQNKLWRIGRKSSSPNSAIWSTNDGDSWTEVQNNLRLDDSKNYIREVFSYDGKLWILTWNRVDDAWEFYSSDDGQDWTLISSNTEWALTAKLSVITYNSQIWLVNGSASTDQNSVWYSNDGDTWSSVNIPYSANIYASRQSFGVEVFNDKLWVLGGRSSGDEKYNDVWSTQDGLNWQIEKSHFSPLTEFEAVVWDTKLFVFNGRDDVYDNTMLHGRQEAWYSDDRVLWHKIRTNFTGRVSHRIIPFNGKLWLYGGTRASGDFQDQIYSSIDGIIWSPLAKDTLDFPSRLEFEIVEFNSKLWVFGGLGQPYSSGNGRARFSDIWHSNDGLNWTEVTMDSNHRPSGNDSRVVVFKGKLWSIDGPDKEVWSSVDGTSWVRETYTASFLARENFQVIEYAGKLWMIAGKKSRSTSLFKDVWSSTDGVNWTLVNDNLAFAARQNHRAVVYGGDMCLIGGTDSSGNVLNDIWCSVDGENWTARVKGTLIFP